MASPPWRARLEHDSYPGSTDGKVTTDVHARVKAQGVKLVTEGGRSTAVVAGDLGLGESMLRAWKPGTLRVTNPVR